MLSHHQTVTPLQRRYPVGTSSAKARRAFTPVSLSTPSHHQSDTWHRCVLVIRIGAVSRSSESDVTVRRDVTGRWYSVTFTAVGCDPAPHKRLGRSPARNRRAAPGYEAIKPTATQVFGTDPSGFMKRLLDQQIRHPARLSGRRWRRSVFHGLLPMNGR